MVSARELVDARTEFMYHFSGMSDKGAQQDDQELHTWLRVQGDDGQAVYRFRVPGGWLYQVVERDQEGGDRWHAPAFVPEPPRFER